MIHWFHKIYGVIHAKKVNFSCWFFKKMALLAWGWSLGRGLLSLAAVGFAFHLQRKVQHLEKCVRKLEDQEESRDMHAEARGFEMQTSEYAVLHPEVSEDLLLKQMKNLQLESREKELSREVEGLKGRVQELEDGSKNLNELYSEASQRGDCMKEMQIKEHAIVKEEVSKDLMQLEYEKSKLSREVERLQKLVRELEDNTTMLMALHNAASHRRECMEKKLLLAEKKVEDYAALNKEASENLKHLESEKQELQSSLNCALEKVKKKLRVFEDYRTEVDIFMDAALEKVPEKEREFENLSFQNERHLQELVELQREIERLSSQEEAPYAKSIPLAAASPMEQSSLPKYCLPPKPSPSSSTCSKSIGRNPRSLLPLHDNPLYETKTTRHTSAALSGHEEVTNGSKFVRSDSISASFIKWHDNPLYESKPARFTAATLSGYEEVTNGSKFVGKSPSSASPVIEWHDNPLYETMTTRHMTEALSGHEELTNDLESIGRDPSSASAFMEWHSNPLYESKPVRFTTAALSSHEEVTTGSEFIGRDPSSSSPVINLLYETLTTRQAAVHGENGANSSAVIPN